MLPCALNNGGFSQMQDLFLNVQLGETVLSLFLAGNCFEFFPVQAIYIFNIPQPHIEHLLKIMVCHGSFYSPTSIMSTHDHMFNLKMNDSIFEHTEQIYVRMDNHIRD